MKRNYASARRAIWNNWYYSGRIINGAQHGGPDDKEDGPDDAEMQEQKETGPDNQPGV